MMLRVINSGSDGNGYALIGENETLLIEAGCTKSDMLKSIDYNVLNIVGCVVSHAHQDHAKYVKDYKNMGIKVIKPYESDIRQIKLGHFTIKFFDLVHDVPCFGAWIHEPSMGTMVFITDTAYCRYRFKNVNTILCEANYSDDLIIDGHEENVRKRVYQTHMSIDTACEFLKVNKSSSLRNVILCHLSGDSGDAEGFITKAQRTVDCPICVARKGVEVKLDEDLF